MARRSVARRARARQGPGHHAPPFDLANERRQVGVDHLRPAIRRGGEAGGRSGGSEARRRTNRPGNHARVGATPRRPPHGHTPQPSPSRRLLFTGRSSLRGGCGVRQGGQGGAHGTVPAHRTRDDAITQEATAAAAHDAVMLMHVAALRSPNPPVDAADQPRFLSCRRGLFQPFVSFASA